MVVFVCVCVCVCNIYIYIYVCISILLSHMRETSQLTSLLGLKKHTAMLSSAHREGQVVKNYNCKN